MTDTNRPHRGIRVLAAYLALALAAFAQNAAPKNFNVPAGEAAAALKTFSQQAGVEVLFPTDAAQGVRTNAVSGSLTPRAALERMVTGTGFEVVQDEKTGALGLRETAEAKNAASRTAPRVVETESGEKAIQMAELRVLGSRIRQTESAGPTPVNIYDRDYIRATGAMTLADFLNYLPQNYSGISAGRGSAPNELNPEFGLVTETSSPLFNFLLGVSDSPPGQTGVSGVSLRGLGSASTLVLVDGRRAAQSGTGNRSTDSRQGFVDLNTIPLGMVERIEIITDGASALYGADAVAGVVNIILKKNWTGTELAASYRGAQHGGGTERTASVTTGFSYGKLRGTVSLDYYSRADLKASQRSFSKNQDHSAIQIGTDASGNPAFGRDLRTSWGYPATVQARTGTLTGVTRPDGTPTNVALTPEGSATTPALSAFIGRGPVPPNTGVFATGQRRGNTAEFLDLTPPSERWGSSVNLTYALGAKTELYAKYTFSNTEGTFSTQPALVSASATSGFGNVATIVPAAFNPFGQDVLVGMILREFGSIRRATETQAHSALFGARGSIGSTWNWDTAVSWQKQDFRQVSREFNAPRITGLLNNPDASQRFNPFIDSRVAGNGQAALLETAANYNTIDTQSKLTSFDVSADGAVFDIWGGPVRMAVGGSFDRAENSSLAATNSVALTPVATTTTAGGDRDSYALFAEAQIPIIGKNNARPENFLRRFEVNVAYRYEDRDQAGTVTVPKYGFTWVPLESWLVRYGYSEGFRAPALTEYP